MPDSSHTPDPASDALREKITRAVFSAPVPIAWRWEWCRTIADAALAAALAPVLALHKPWHWLTDERRGTQTATPGVHPHDAHKSYCEHCRGAWPCATIRTVWGGEAA